MSHHSDSLASLIGSRICHDLISPIGAVSNGLELLELSGAAKGPELMLVAESVANANARIQFFRLAFGMASTDQLIGGDEVGSILSGVYKGGRVSPGPFPTGDHPRAVVRAVLLAMLCAEQAIPHGGDVSVTRDDDHWQIVARGSRIAPDPDLWGILTGTAPVANLQPAAVQFLLLPDILAGIYMKCETQASDSAAEICLSPVSCHPHPQDI